jgi:transcriptional regulator with XRE-family HTH domain
VAQRDNHYLQAFGNNLRKVRLAKGLSQEDLADKADSVLSQIGRIERGERAPNILTVKKLADALEVNPGDLFDFTANRID